MVNLKALIRLAWYYSFRARGEVFRLFDRMRPKSSKKKVIIFDPALHGYLGHHLEFARMIKAELSNQFDLRFCGNFYATTRIVIELPLNPICRHTIYTASGDFHTVNAQMTKSLVESLGKIDLRHLTPRTTFVMHTLTVYMLSGLAEWFTSLPPEHRPKLILQFQFSLEFGLELSSDRLWAVTIARKAVEVLIRSGNVVFTTNSDLLQQRLSLQLGHSCLLMPLPIRWPDQAQNVPAPYGVVFGFYGGLRVEKGSRIVAEAISTFAKLYRDTHFIVHAPLPESDQVAADQLSGFPNIEIIKSPLLKDNGEYFMQLGRAHFVLVPYDPTAYDVRTSTVFLEALGLGRPVITTAGTWMANQLRNRSPESLIMKSYSAEALYECLIMARECILRGSWNDRIDVGIRSSCTSSAFCAALSGAIQD